MTPPTPELETPGSFERLTRRHPWLMPLVSLVVFSLAIYALYQLLHEISLTQLLDELKRIPPHRLILAGLFVALSYLAMVGYDWSALRYINRRLPMRTVATASFCGYAFSNTIGLALISGASVRYRFYAAAGLDAMDVARVAAFCALAYGVGVHAVGAVALAWQPAILASHFGWSEDTLRAVGIFGLIVLGAGFVWLAVRRRTVRLGRWQLMLPSWRLTLFQLALSMTDVLFAGAALYVLLPAGSVPFGGFILVFVVAVLAGVASHVPGGLGVFEGVLLLALREHIPPETLSAALVVFRGVYFLLPLVLATVLLAYREFADRAQPALERIHQFGSWSARLAPTVMSGFAFLAGLVMLISAATPAAPERMRTLESAVPNMVVEVSHLMAALVGLSMLALARGLYRRLNAAYALLLLLCAGGIAVSLTKGLDYWGAAVLAVVGLIVFLARKEFYRRTHLLDSSFTPVWIIALLGAVAAMVGVMMFAFKHVEFSYLTLLQFGFDHDFARALRATLAVVLGAVFLVATFRLRSPHTHPTRPSANSLVRAREAVDAQDYGLANLSLLGDKSLMFNETSDAFVMFGVSGSTFVALGDPVGGADQIEDLAWQFREYVDLEGGRVAFFQVRPEHLPVYLDMGLIPLKIGDEAVVDLGRPRVAGSESSSSIESPDRREQLEFEHVPAGAAIASVDELRLVSDDWLRMHGSREMQYTTGAFGEDYLRRCDIGIVRLDGRIVAFATLLKTATKVEASVDLLRHRANAPKHSVSFLIAQVASHLHALGFRRLTVGMAPPLDWEKQSFAASIASRGAVLYRRGDCLLNVTALRAFKESFGVAWEPRYLVTQGATNPEGILKDIASLTVGPG